MSDIVDIWRQTMVAAWAAVPFPSSIEELPASKAQLWARVKGSDSFDGGHTARWLASTGPTVCRAVRDPATGHTVHVVSDRNDRGLTDDLVLALRLMAWMTVGTGPMTLYWWDQPWPRVLPANTLPGRDHINGGWATPGVREVHVYRREEAHKVLLHESIHALGLDVAVPPSVVAAFEADLGRRLWPHLGEAYTELLAEWLWSIASGPRGPRWHAQVVCAQSQAVAVWARIRDSTVPEDTNVFAYYILKWVLMKHLREMILSPGRTVPSWLAWWRVARSELDEKVRVSGVRVHKGPLRLGMTCGS